MNRSHPAAARAWRILRRGSLAAVSVVLSFAPPLPAQQPPAAPAGRQVSLPYVLIDNLGGAWDVQPDGTIGDGGNDVYDGGCRLTIGEEQYASPAPAAAFDAKRNEIVLPPVPLRGLNVGRRVTVNAKDGWCRWVETFENAGKQPVHVPLHLNFDLGGAIAQTKELVDEKKTKQPVALATFDGNHALAMVGAGRGAKVLPRFQPQPGNDQVDVFYDFDVPPGRTVAVAHVQVLRKSFGEAVAFMEAAKDKDYLADLPPEVVKTLANFPAGGQYVGDAEILRGDGFDVVELRAGGEYRGTLLDAGYKLRTPYGVVDLTAGQVVGMLTAGTFKPAQLFVTADGQVIGGTLLADAVRLKLASGQVVAVPPAAVGRLGYRKRPGEPAEWPMDRPLAILRDGQRVGIEPPTEPLPLATVYGPLAIRPDAVAAVVFPGDGRPVQTMRLTDGSKFSALIARESFTFRPRGIGATRPLTFPAAALTRLQFRPGQDDPDDEAPALALSNGDTFAGVLGGTLELETGFDTIRVSGPEVHALRHLAPAGGVPAAPAEVRLTLWDGVTLSGRLKGEVVSCQLGCGAAVTVPVALVDHYANPNPLPTPQVMEQIRSAVADLGSADWQRRDRATDRLLTLGPAAAGVLKSLRPSQPESARPAIDALLQRLDEIKQAAKAPPPVPPVPADTEPVEEQPVQEGADVQLVPNEQGPG